MENNISRNQSDGYTRWEKSHQGESISITDDKLASDRDIKINEIHGNTWQDPNNLSDIRSVGELYVDVEGNPILDGNGNKQYKIEVESKNKKGFKMFCSLNTQTKKYKIEEGTYQFFCNSESEMQFKIFTWHIDGSAGLRGNTFPMSKSKSCTWSIPRDIVHLQLQAVDNTNENLEVLVANDVIEHYDNYQSNKTTILLPQPLNSIITSNPASPSYWDGLVWSSVKGHYEFHKHTTYDLVEEWIATKCTIGNPEKVENGETMVRKIQTACLGDSTYQGLEFFNSKGIFIQGLKNVNYSYFRPQGEYTFDFIGNTSNLTIFLPESYDTKEKVLEFFKNKRAIFKSASTPIIDLPHLNTQFTLSTYSPTTHIINDTNGVSGNMIADVPYREFRTPQEPNNLQFTKGSSNIHTLTWDECSNTSSYDILLGTEVLKNVTTNSCTLERDVVGLLSVTAKNDLYSKQSYQIYVDTLNDRDFYLRKEEKLTNQLTTIKDGIEGWVVARDRKVEVLEIHGDTFQSRGDLNYIASLGKIKTEVVHKDIWENKEDVIQNVSIDGNSGKELQNVNYNSSKYIEVIANTHYTYNYGTGTNLSDYLMVWYRLDKKFLGISHRNGVAPTDAHYVRISFKKTLDVNTLSLMGDAKIPVLDKEGNFQYEIDVIKHSSNLWNGKDFLGGRQDGSVSNGSVIKPDYIKDFKVNAHYGVDFTLTASSMRSINIGRIPCSGLLGKVVYVSFECFRNNTPTTEFGQVQFTFYGKYKEDFINISPATSSTWVNNKRIAHITIPNNLDIYSFSIQSLSGGGIVAGDTSSWRNIMITEGSHSDFKPQMCSKETISLPQPLMGCKDFYDKFYWDDLKGHYCISKKYHKIDLMPWKPKDNSGWQSKDNTWQTNLWGTPYLSTGTFELDRKIASNNYYQFAFCNAFLYSETEYRTTYGSGSVSSKTNENIGLIGYKSPQNNLKFKCSFLKTGSVTPNEGIMNWFDEVQPYSYLPHETIEVIDLPHLNKKIEFQTYENVTHVTNTSNELVGNMIVKAHYRKPPELPTRPINLTFTENNETGHVVSWSASTNTFGYHVYIGETKLLTTKETTCTINHELDGYLKVVAYNPLYEVESDLILVKTTPSKPTDFTVDFGKVNNDYVFTVRFRDNSDIETGHQIVYLIDGIDEFTVDIAPTPKGVVAKTIQTATTNIGENILFKVATIGKTIVFAEKEIVFNRPSNIVLTTVGTTTTITWNEMEDVDGYNIYLDNKLVATTPTNSYVFERDLYGFIHLVAFKNGVELLPSDTHYIKTMPNAPLWVDVNHSKTELGYDMQVEFTDNSVIETHYRVEYQVDDGSKQTFDIDTENMELPPNTHLDEDKTYLMWSNIESTDGTNVAIEGVRGEQVHEIKLSGNTDQSGYYPMSVGTTEQIEIGVNDDKTPIVFETFVKSSGEEKEIVDVARFQEIKMIIEGNTVRDEVNNTLNSVKPMIYNEKGIAHTMTLDNIKGKTEVRYDKLASREEYGCTLGNVQDVIDQLYKDKVVYRTKEYFITGRESWQIDNMKTNGTYTTVSNIVLDNCITYKSNEVFKAISNKFTSQSYDDTTFSHLKCMYTDKLSLMFQNTQVGITGTDSTSAKITKCKNYLMSIEPSIRYEVKVIVEEPKEIGLFVGDSFELGEISGRKDICNTMKSEVAFNTKEYTLNEMDNWSHNGNNGEYYAFNWWDVPNKLPNGVILCDTLKILPAFGFTEEGFFNGASVNIILHKSKATSIDEFKNWLSHSQIKIRYAVETPYTEKINILQDAFVVDSQDGGDREVEIVNNHFEEDKVIQKGLIKETSKTQSYTSWGQDIQIGSQIIVNGYYNEDERSKPTNKIFQSLSISGGFVFGFDSSGIPYCQFGGTPYLGLGLPSRKDGYYEIIITVIDEYVFDLTFTHAEKTNQRRLTSTVSIVGANKVVAIFSLPDYSSINEMYANCLTYNRKLTEEERNYNKNILNNKQDKSHILLTENQEEKAVSGGIESGFLSGNIEGETFKSICKNGGFKDKSHWSEVGSFVGKVDSGVYSLEYRDEPHSPKLRQHFWKNEQQPFVKNGKYYLSCEIKLTNFTNKKVSITTYRDENYNGLGTAIHGVCEDNWTKISGIMTATSSGEYSLCSMQITVDQGFIQGRKAEFRNVLAIDVTGINTTKEEMDSKTSKYLEKGLHSTQVIININDQEYPIYNPIIEGFTEKIGGNLIGMSTSDSSLPTLHGNYFVKDEIDLHDRKLTKKFTREYQVTGDENWVYYSKNNGYSFALFDLPNGNGAINGGVICDKFESRPHSMRPCMNNVFLHPTYGSLCFYIKTSELREDSITAYKEKLKQLKPKVIYEGREQQVITLTQEQIELFSSFKKPIELHSVNGVCDEIIVNEDGSGTWIERFKDIHVWRLGYNGTSMSTTNEFGGFVRLAGIQHTDMKDGSDSISDVSPTTKFFSEEGYCMGYANYIYYMVDKNKASIVQEDSLSDMGKKALDWLENNIRNKDGILRVTLLNPVVTHIPRHLMPHIQIQQNY